MVESVSEGAHEEVGWMALILFVSWCMCLFVGM